MYPVIPDLENRRIGDFQHSSDILESMKQIRDNLKVEDRNARLVCDDKGKDLSLDTECAFFPKLRLSTLTSHIDDSKLEGYGKSSSGLVYRIYHVPEKYTKIIDLVRDVWCSKYHRAYLQTPDGIINHDFGECSADSI